MVKGERTRYECTPEKFVEVWQSSDSVEEVSRRLSMSAAICHDRASKYRRKGVKLKSMPRKAGRKGLDVEGLNRLIQQLETGLPPPKGASVIDEVVGKMRK